MFILFAGMIIPCVLSLFGNPMAAEIVIGMRHGNFSYAILIVSLVMYEANLSANRRTRRALTDKLQDLTTRAKQRHRQEDKQMVECNSDVIA